MFTDDGTSLLFLLACEDGGFGAAVEPLVEECDGADFLPASFPPLEASLLSNAL